MSAVFLGQVASKDADRLDNNLICLRVRVHRIAILLVDLPRTHRTTHCLEATYTNHGSYVILKLGMSL